MLSLAPHGAEREREMCKWGTDVLLDVPVLAKDSHTGKAYIKKDAGIDSCLAPIVKALLDAGIGTYGSCCGHGNSYGWIKLDGGKLLMIAYNCPDSDDMVALNTAMHEVDKKHRPQNELVYPEHPACKDCASAYHCEEDQLGLGCFHGK